MNFHDIINRLDSLIITLSSEDNLNTNELEAVYNILDKFNYQNLTKTEANLLVEKISVINSCIEEKKSELLNKLENKNREIEMLKDIKKNIQELINIS
ncbi:MAG: hypothetical protein N2Z81_06490 [Hydrogenothermaceae bacterium]|nr:hypothetical protein [Hydrogenothermaceae bacterium]